MRAHRADESNPGPAKHARVSQADRTSNPGPAKHARVSQAEAGAPPSVTEAAAPPTATAASGGATVGSPPQALLGPPVARVLTPDERDVLGDNIVERLRTSGLAVAAVHQRACVQANALVAVVMGCSERTARNVLQRESAGMNLPCARWASGPAISVCEVAHVRVLAGAVLTQKSPARLSGDECESLFRVIADVYSRTAFMFAASPLPDEDMRRIPVAADAPLQLLRAIEDVLGRPDIETALRERAGRRDADGSVDFIGNGRVEVFIRGNGVDTQTWDTVLAPGVAQELGPGWSTTRVTVCLLEYAVKQAHRDGRLPSSHIMNNFSLIITWGCVPCQSLHIDLLPPLWQFGMAISSECAATVWARRRMRVSSVADLRLVGPFVAAPPQLCATLSNHRHVSDPDLNVSTLLGSFGQVFGSDPSLLVSDEATLRPGECMSLPGGVLHGGPAVGGRDGDSSGGRPRVVLFFSACPPGHTDYDPKTV